MTKTRTVIDRRSASVGMRMLFWILLAAVVIGAFGVPLLLADAKRDTLGDVLSKYREGSLSEVDIVANETFYYIDEVLTKELQREASNAILPIFSYSLAQTRRVLETIDEVFLSFQAGSDSSTSVQRAKRAMTDQGIHDSAGLIESLASLTHDERQLVHSIVLEATEALLEQGVYSAKEINDVQQNGYLSITVKNSVDSNELSQQTVYGIDQLLTDTELTKELIDILRNYRSLLSGNQHVLVFDLATLFVRPNVHYDQLETSIAKHKASEDVAPASVKVEKGQYILKKDFVITSQDVRTLQALILAEVRYTFLEIVGMLLFVLIMTFGSVYLLRYLFVHSLRRELYVLFFLGGIFLTQLFSFLVLNIFAGWDLPYYEPLLPVLVVPNMLALMTNRKRSGYIAAVLLGAYAVLLPNATLTTVFFIVAECFCGIHFIKYVSRRAEMLFQWFYGVVVTSFLVVINNLLLGYAFDDLLLLISITVLNITLTYVIVTAALPLVERIFNIPTAFRLRELAYGDSPLLSRLAQNAQGTYNHAQAVAEMAYTAAVAIGADALLARVGALYHDVGKLDHPEYFIENQDGDNKHDELTTSLSVAIIKSHVKLGTEKGKEARLPVEVLDIISQHHGNDVIAFFLKEAQSAAEQNGSKEVNVDDYRYTSIPPQTPEAAIVMLADSVEAASRSIRKPSLQKYEKLVHQIVLGKIDRKQLVASRLSLTDLDVISTSFVQTLAGKYHTRMVYPGSHVEEEPK